MISSSLDHRICALLAMQRQSGQPQILLDAMRDLCEDHYGFRLLTLMKYHPSTGEIQRVYTSMPDHFPLGGRKMMNATGWGKHVLVQGNVWLGNSAKEILETFPDADNILRYAGEACACLPVRWNDQTLAVLSLCDQKGKYSTSKLDEMAKIAQTLVPVVMECN